MASEPATNEFLALTPDDTALVNETTGLRNYGLCDNVHTSVTAIRMDFLPA